MKSAKIILFGSADRSSAFPSFSSFKAFSKHYLDSCFLVWKRGFQLSPTISSFFNDILDTLEKKYFFWVLCTSISIIWSWIIFVFSVCVRASVCVVSNPRHCVHPPGWLHSAPPAPTWRNSSTEYIKWCSCAVLCSNVHHRTLPGHWHLLHFRQGWERRGANDAKLLINKYSRKSSEDEKE